MGTELAAIWKCRYFWLSLVKMDLRSRYRRSILGLGWSLLQPIAMTAILCAVFHKIFHQPLREMAPHMFSGLTCWQFLLSVTMSGCQCFFNGESYIRQHPAPLAIYPLRTALGGLVHFLIALGVVLVMSWIAYGFGNVPALITLVPAVVLTFMLSWCLAVMAGFATVYFQDTQHLAELGFQMLFYLTPIIYKEEQLINNGLMWVLRYNPVVPFLRMFREPILLGQVPTPMTFLKAGLIVLTALVIARFLLSRCQKRLVFQL